MLSEFIGVLQVAGETVLKIVPITAALGIGFAFLTVGRLPSPETLVAQTRDRQQHSVLVPRSAGVRASCRIGLMVIGRRDALR